MIRSVKEFFNKLAGDIIYWFLQVCIALGTAWSYIKGHKYSRYWMAHIIVALAISRFMVAFAANHDKPEPLLAFSGSLLYLGRETAQVMYEPEFDTKGFLAPLIACIIYYIYLTLK